MLWFLPFLTLIIILFSINIVKTDYLFGNNLLYTHKPGYNWIYDYTIIPIKKFYLKVINNNIDYLPKVKLYINQQKLNYFLSDIPSTTKIWQSGKIVHFLDKDHLRDIKIRLKSDNPSNWFTEKQSFRVKLKKKEMHGRTRYYNYQPFSTRTLISNRLAKKSKILAPEVRPIEFLINDERKGLYLEVEHLNENFLRRNKVMPVNFYKGENVNQETKIALPPYLYSNSGLWSKIAYFNFFDKDYKNDLQNFLKILNNSKNNLSNFNLLKTYLDDEYMGRYLAYLVLSQNFHSSRIHNNRLIIDSWKGQVFPVVTDPSLPFLMSKNLDQSNNDLASILNQNSHFLNLKFFYLKKLLFEEKVLDEEINYLINSRENIISVMKKDPVLINIIPEIFIKNKNFELIDRAIDLLEDRKKNLKEELNKTPKAVWINNKKYFSIIIDDQLPINNLELLFEKDTPEWVFIDENYNNIFDEDEVKFYRKNNKIYLNATLFSNRVNTNDIFNLSHNNISIVPTKFNLISSNGNFPSKINMKNFFLQKYVSIKKQDHKNLFSTELNLLNKVIKENKLKKNLKPKVLSGEILVNKNLIFEKPVKILEGTTFLIEKGKNIFFKNRIEAKGTKKNKIKFISKSKEPWGTVAIIGKKTSGSYLSNLNFENGSGNYDSQFSFTSMLSIHNTKNINISNATFYNNKNYDDMLHIIYSSNIFLDNLTFKDAYGDAIDVDMSENIFIENSKFYNSNNDAIDLMESNVMIKNVDIINSKDKGVSIGEASDVKIFSSKLMNNNIALAIKDGSKSNSSRIKFINNKIQIAAYKKNLQYGSGGELIIADSKFVNNLNKFSSKDSKIIIKNSELIGNKILDGKNINFYD